MNAADDAAAEPIADGPFQPNWESLAQYQMPGLVPRRQVRHLGALDGRSACPSRATGTPARCTSGGQSATTTTRCEHYGHPSKVGLQGHRPPLAGRELGPGAADRAVQGGRGQILRGPGQPPRQLRLLRLASTSRGTRSTSARRRTSSAAGRRPRARPGCASASPSTPPAPGAGTRSPRARTRTARWRACRTTAS